MLVKPLVRPIVRAIAGNPTASLGSGFSPTSLFADGSKGVVYDNNDLSSFFLDSALTTPATVNGLVGGQLDKSGNGFHRTQATTGSKPVLRGTPTGANLVTNGDFASASNWVLGTGWSIGSGKATHASGTTGNITQDITMTAGNVYRLTYTVSGLTTGNIGTRFFGGTTTAGTTRTANGTYVEYLTAQTGNGQLAFVASATFDGSIDDAELVDVSAGSVTAPYGLQYDGVDDFMQTASVDFTATDKMFVCAGVRKLSDSAQGVVASLGSVATTAGTFEINAPSGVGLANYAMQLKGATTLSTYLFTTYASPVTNVISFAMDYAAATGSEVIARVNGATPTISAGVESGVGPFANQIMYFGRRTGTALPYNGLDFGMVICGKTLTSTQISQTERYIAQRTGISL